MTATPCDCFLCGRPDYAVQLPQQQLPRTPGDACRNPESRGTARDTCGKLWRIGEIGQLIKALVTKPDDLSPQNPQGGEKEITSASCPLNCTCAYLMHTEQNTNK